MANDNPDYSIRPVVPAILLTAFTVPLNSSATVFSGALPAGTHALKVYIQNTTSGIRATQVTITDTATGAVIAAISNPTSPALVFAVDDITTPNIAVLVATTVGNATTGSVAAFLSDQAVFVDNVTSNPVATVEQGNQGGVAGSIFMFGSPGLRGGPFSVLADAASHDVVGAPAASRALYVVSISYTIAVVGTNALRFSDSGGDIAVLRPDNSASPMCINYGLPGVRLATASSLRFKSDLNVANQLVAGSVGYYIGI